MKHKTNNDIMCATQISRNRYMQINKTSDWFL